MLTLSNGSQIQLSVKPLGRGGEGEVFEIKYPKHHINNVAKIFHDAKRTPERERKLKYLINNPPQIEENGHTFLIWPLDILYDDDKFIGFIMPRAEGIELELLCDDDFLNYPEYQGSAWEKFAFSKPNSPMTRLKIAYNICAAVAAVHAKKDYVLGDLKPVNIKITDKGLICIIDLDSIQVTEKGKVLFASKVATPEYSPPEASQNQIIKDEYWDRFSLAVIIYRVLVGIHPFSGSLKPPHDKITVYEDLIKNGFYPHGRNRNKFAVINDTHNNLFNYPNSVVDTFKKAFDTFLTQPDKRPSAIEWCNALTTKPEILKFEADKTFVLPNTPVCLRWNVKNATTIEIDNGIGDVTNRSMIDWTIVKPSRFTLKATNPFGSVYSDPIEVATLNLKVPNSIFIPTPEFNLQVNFPTIKGINQIPSPNFPTFSTPNINVNTNLVQKINGNFQLKAGKRINLIQRMKDNYEWTKNILQNSNYQLSFDDFLLYKIYDWVVQLRTFLKNLKTKK
jgi:DNA-binding helix-hairpin-helix protein with protein kinase domain